MKKIHMRGRVRRDKKRRILRAGESVRIDGKYQFKYMVNGHPKFLYSWKLEPTDPLPPGRKPCLSLREMEDSLEVKLVICPNAHSDSMTVLELVQRYLMLKKGVKPNTLSNYKFIVNALKKDPFSQKAIGKVKMSDAKLWLIKMQSEGKGYSTIHSIRGVVRTAFQMAVDDEILWRNPFNFEMKDVLINDSVRREALSKRDMRIFLEFIRKDEYFKRYYEGIYILFHTGLRISEFCALTVNDIDLEKRTINVDKQLQKSNGKYYILSTKTKAGARLLPMTDEVYRCFVTVLQQRRPPKVEPIIDGVGQFLFYDNRGLPRVALHWQKYFQHILKKYNSTYKYQLPKITPHVCRHTYCTNMALSGVSAKTLQYLMGHSDIGVTLNVYTHIKFDDAQKEVEVIQARQQKEMESVREELEKVGEIQPKVIRFPGERRVKSAE